MNRLLPRSVRRLVLPALCFAATASAATAFDEFDVVLAEAPLPETRLLVGDDDTIAFAAGELHGERVVKGAPYCADAELESVQPLADGNRIVRRQTTRLCRDGEGRTRQEVERGGRRIVYLRDPVAGESWVLDPERKSARQLAGGGLRRDFVHPDASAWREYAEKMREWARGFSERMRRDPGGAAPAAPMPPAPSVAPAAVPAVPPMPAIVAEDEHTVRDAEGREQREVQMHVLRWPGPGAALQALPGMPAMVAPLPPGVALRAQLGAPRGPGVASSLGGKEIEGVKVNGERTTWTIEAGKVGNEKPIVISRELWTSPELMLTVMSRDADPRVGETTYRLARLRRGEPDAALMRVPADYTPRPASAPRGKG